MSKTIAKFLIALAIICSASLSLAAGPSWMPGFPMRMGTNVMLMWSPIPGATGYNLYRSEKSGDIGKLLTSIPMNNHMDMNVPMDKDAAYTVKAVIGGAEGDASPQSVIAGVKPLDAPKFTGDIFQNDQLNVRWDRVNGAAFYNVYKSETKEGPFSLAGSIQEVMYVDAGVTAGKTYYYQVSAVDKNNVESPRSETREIAIAKAAVVAKRITYEHAEKLMKHDGDAYGGTLGPYNGPGNMVYNSFDKKVYVAGDNYFFSMDMAGNIVMTFLAPADYVGKWGKPLQLAIDQDNGNIWTTWRQGASMVKVFNTAGALVGEASLDFPKEDYEAEGREADMKEDAGLVPAAAGIAVDAEGEIWVADNVFGQIIIYNSNFDRIGRLHSPRSRTKDDAKINGITSIVYDAKHNRIIALDALANRFRPYDAAKNDFVKNEAGENFYGWDKSGTGAGYYQLSKGISTTDDGHLLVVAGESGAIQALDLNSKDLAFSYFLQTESGKDKIRSSAIDAPAGVLSVGNKVFVSDKLSDLIGIFTVQ
ncbi:hypothetical protein EPN96_00850 [bacterium]|nr:MAG: hypothetical protein EPN96_00850 [bacterium]